MFCGQELPFLLPRTFGALIKWSFLLDPPSITKQLQHAVQLPLGGQLILECAATGNPFPQIQWTKDGSPKIPNAQFHDRKTRLTVDSVRVDDIGVYQCSARNLLGTDQSNKAAVDVESTSAHQVFGSWNVDGCRLQMFSFPGIIYKF